MGCGATGCLRAGMETPEPWSRGREREEGIWLARRLGPPLAPPPPPSCGCLSARPPPSAQARPWRREIPASTCCDAPGRRRRSRGPSPLGWPCGGRRRPRPHFSAFPNCGRREGARRAGASVRLRTSRGGGGRCGGCVLGPGKDRVGSRVLILSARDLA